MSEQGFDPARDRHEVIEGIVYVVPKFEPFACARKIGNMAVFIYCRWDAWGLGLQLLRAGVAAQVGPCMFGICHIDRQLAAYAAQTPSPKEE